ncbi:hypothetical protein N5P37_002479 [Trichoderma harzianum]|nr:hypothetical protein N5P37_002479 [Trichoderma harzianum]
MCLWAWDNQIRCAVIAISAAEASQYGRNTVVLVEWMDEVSVQTTPNTLQQKAHLDGGSQSYRHGWRRSSFNSSWFEREARTSHLFGKSTQCQCLAHEDSLILWWRESTTCQDKFQYCDRGRNGRPFFGSGSVMDSIRHKCEHVQHRPWAEEHEQLRH